MHCGETVFCGKIVCNVVSESAPPLDCGLYGKTICIFVIECTMVRKGALQGDIMPVMSQTALW